MKVLAVNCGSSSLKFEVFEIADGIATLGQERRLAHGIVDRLGPGAAVRFRAENGSARTETAAVASQQEAVRRMLAWLDDAGLLGPDGVAAIGHRVVHGGQHFTQPVLIDDRVLAAIDDLRRLAPLHNLPALNAIRAARSVLGPSVPMVATFDTAFHRSMPERAALYAIPRGVAEPHGIRRYGFHGLAHRYMTERYAALTGTPPAQVKLITLQLGNGCSAAAVQDGRSVDTSMGFTPLEGLIMGTRSGDVDPSLPAYLGARQGTDPETVVDLLNTRSGLLGISGHSADMRELLELEWQGDEDAGLAIEMFCYRVRKYVGAYLAALGGAQAVVFGGGIGEHAATVRARICAGMEWCGLIIDADRNEQMIGAEGRISSEAARLHAYVLPVNEAAIIAHDTARCLHYDSRT